jgi:predicted TIM-barrel fold metal-dependent hydrolase
MSAIPFFDCACMIGMRANRHRRTIYKLADYRREFAYHDIMGAVVFHAIAKEHNCDYGNRRLLDEIGADPQLVPQWVLLPHHCGEMPPPADLVEEMLALGVRTARLYPTLHGFGTAEHVIGPLLAELERRRMPLFLDLTEVPWDELIPLCQAHPLLPMVLSSTSWSTDRRMYPALQQCPNLHIETWAQQAHRGYERFIAEFGPERLLFGTDLPYRSPGAARMMVNYEQISDEDRRKIAGGNILRLLRNVQGASNRPLPELKAPPEHPDDDPIVASVRAGKPLSDQFICDAHGHLGHDGSMGIRQAALPWQDADHMIASMDRIGIDVFCFSPYLGVQIGNPASNDISIAACEQYPGRLLAYGCANPNYPELVEAELRRVFGRDDFIGYKPYPAEHGVPLDDPAYEPIMQWLNENEAPLLGHGATDKMRGLTPDVAMTLAERYPGAKFIIAHTGRSYTFAEAVIAAANKFSNIYAEITYTAILYNLVEMLCEEMPVAQVLYGSDAPMRDPVPQVGWVAWARIPYEQKQKVLGHNMADLLKMPLAARYPRA